MNSLDAPRKLTAGARGDSGSSNSDEPSVDRVLRIARDGSFALVRELPGVAAFPAPHIASRRLRVPPQGPSLGSTQCVGDRAA